MVRPKSESSPLCPHSETARNSMNQSEQWCHLTITAKIRRQRHTRWRLRGGERESGKQDYLIPCSYDIVLESPLVQYHRDIIIIPDRGYELCEQMYVLRSIFHSMSTLILDKLSLSLSVSSTIFSQSLLFTLTLFSTFST